MMNRSKGITLIALIITIIVIIILAAIVIGGVFNTPKQASYAKFCSDIATAQEAVTTAHGTMVLAVAVDPDRSKIDDKKIILDNELSLLLVSILKEYCMTNDIEQSLEVFKEKENN